jgi:hypothetical protein
MMVAAFTMKLEWNDEQETDWVCAKIPTARFARPVPKIFLAECFERWTKPR